MNRLLPLIGAILLVASEQAAACAVCGGDPESNVVQGAEKAIIVLGIIVYGVLMGMACVGASWFIRARRLAAEEIRMS